MANDKNAASTVRSFSDAAKASGLPVHVDREFIASLGTVIWTGVEATQATNPQTGAVEDGLLAHITDPDDDQLYTTYVGNVILLKFLGAMEFPFSARLVKKGRSWTFAD